MFRVSKSHFIKFFLVCFVFVFLFNMLFNREFSMFLSFFYGDVNSSIVMDANMFVKIFLVLIGETWVMSWVFYYVTKVLL